MTIYHSTVQTQSASIRLSESDGHGEPLLLLHGSGASRKVFSKQFNSPLAEQYRLIALDLPGHGASSDAVSAADYGVDGLARTVAEVLQLKGIEHTLVMGWSLGGHVGIELMARHPAVTGLMVVGAPPVGRGPVAMLRGFQTNLDLLLATKEQFSEREAQRFYEMCYHGAGEPTFLQSIRRTDGRVRVAASRSLLKGEVADQKLAVEQASVPVAIVNGASEPVARLSYLAGLHYRNLWGNVCHIIPDAGHAPFWDQPERFNELLGSFAADVAAKPVATTPAAAGITPPPAATAPAAPTSVSASARRGSHPGAGAVRSAARW
jgi:pimeloyl-ACP methyl ester carboxylesterase